MGQGVVHFEENIKSPFHKKVKSAFHKTKNPIYINKVDIKRIELSDKKQMVKICLNSLLDIDIIVMLFHLHYT